MSESTTHFCDTPASVADAMRTLRIAPFLFLDSEGWELGTTKGRLSVISIGTPNAENVYLIDAIALSKSDIQPILDLLQAKKPTKYVWDGRMDFREILATYNVSLKGVIDLTLADIASRTTRGQGDYESKRRLSDRYHPSSLFSNIQTKGVHRLCGLRYACGQHEHNIDLSGIFSMPFGRKPDWAFFLKRPLLSHLRTYAASDIQTMARLHTEFSEQGYLGKTQELMIQSQRFFNVDPNRVSLLDVYKMSPFLPMEVMDEGGHPIGSCSHCKRQLCEDSFDHKLSKGKMVRTDSCKVCRAIDVWRR